MKSSNSAKKGFLGRSARNSLRESVSNTTRLAIQYGCALSYLRKNLAKYAE